MKRPPRKPHAVYVPPEPDPALSPAQLAAISDRILSGDVYQCGSVNEFTALLAVLHERGQVIRHRADRATGANPWLFTVVLEEATIAQQSTTEKEGQTKRHSATAQADPLRGGE